jgi:hypothetical protein
MEKINVTISVSRAKLEKLIEIGDRPYKEIMGTDLEKEYDDLRKDVGFRVIMKYKNCGADPA